MDLIDTHAHIYEKAFSHDLPQVIQNSVGNHVKKIYMPNIDANTIDAILAVAKKYTNLCAPMMGLHPCAVNKNFEKQLYVMEEWLAKKKFVAIGEVGIDLYRDTTYRAQQQAALVVQLQWAKKYRLPVVIHCRNGFEKICHVIAQHKDEHLQGIFHCFSSNLKDAQRIIDMGFCLGIGGIVTFKNSGLGKVLSTIDFKHMVLETDSPYLAPTPYRGKRNEPAHVLYVAEALAHIKQVTLATVAKHTSANAQRIFHTTIAE